MNAASPDHRRSARSWVLVAGIVAAVLAVDQVTKAWALDALGTGRAIEVVGSLRFRLAFNTGTAFGLGARYAPLIALVAVVVVVLLLGAGRAMKGVWPRLGLALVVGGAIGNLADRVFRAGESGALGGAVVDFIDLQWWPVFNVADSCICVGAVLLVLTAREPDPDATPDGAEAEARSETRTEAA